MAASFVNVSVESVHIDAAENQDVIKCLVIGKKNEHKGKIYISYNEPDENCMPGTKTILKLDGESITLTRTGEVEHKFVFQAGMRTYSDYRTPFGMLRMAVETKALEIDVDDNVINIYIEYLLMINDDLQGLTRLRIRVGEDKRVGH